MLIVIVFLIFVILIIIVALCSNKSVLGGSEHTDKYAYLFTITKDEYESALKHSEMKYISNLIKNGKSPTEIGITQQQYDMIVGYNKSFHILSVRIDDVYTKLVNYELARHFDESLSVLSVGTSIYLRIKNTKIPCTKHDAFLFINQYNTNRIEKELCEKSSYSDYLKKFCDNVYGQTYGNGPDDEIPIIAEKLSIINKLDELDAKYDIINFCYFDMIGDFYKYGPISVNTEFECIYTGIVKSLQLLKIGGRMTIVINLVYVMPISNVFDKLAKCFGSYSVIGAKNQIVISLSDYKQCDIDCKLIYKEFAYSFYGIKDIKTVPCMDEVQSPIVNDIENCFILYYSALNSTAFNLPPSIDNMIYENIRLTIELYKKRGIPYDSYYIDIATNYYKQVYIDLIAINSTIKSAICRFEKRIPKITQTESYYYSDDLGRKLNACGKLDYSVNVQSKYKEFTQDFTRGVSKYLTDNFTINVKRISNAFVKLWEIYHTFNLINRDTNAFHMCEAPGQWIKTTEYYNSKRGNYAYTWLANSLNPWNKENIKKYGNDIISDTYGLLKQNKHKWLFAADNTGDIMKSSNIRWYRKNVKNINLVTGDAGLPTELPLILLQKLDYSQALITLATAGNGAHCVIKCFTPYLKSNIESHKATGFFVNLMYLYYMYFDKLYLYKPYSSNPYSGEFYIVGKNFTGISDEDLEKLLKVQDDFSANCCFVKKDDISKEFLLQIYNFLEKLTELNINTLDRRYFLFKLGNDKDAIVKYSDLNDDKMEIIRTERFKVWIDMFNFI